MSEYQLYEFQAIDRPLSSEDQTYVRSLSSRVKLTATSALFSYGYSGFQGKNEKLLERCFDMMLYVASFGVRQLLIRLPKTLVDAKSLAPYCGEDGISVSTTARSIILDIEISQEAYYTWVHDEGYLIDMVGIREDLIKGDLRVLYLAWLAAGFIEDSAIAPEENIEPPVPEGLKQLTPALQSFADFFAVNEDLIAAAAEESADRPASGQAEPIADWIAALSETERNAYLLRVVSGETHVGAELKQHLRQKFGKVKSKAAKSPGRSLAELMERAEEIKTQRDRKSAQANAKARLKYLDELAPRANQIWQEVDRLIELKQAMPYDTAVEHLVDLRDLAKSEGTLKQFQPRVQALAQKFSTRSALLSRLRKAKLMD